MNDELSGFVLHPGESSPVITVEGPALSRADLVAFRQFSLAHTGPKCPLCGTALNKDELGLPACEELCIYGQMMEAGK